MIKFHLTAYAILCTTTYTRASNVVILSGGDAAVLSNPFSIQILAPTNTTTTTTTTTTTALELPPGITTFADVAVPRFVQTDYLFALSTDDRQVCSFQWTRKNTTTSTNTNNNTNTTTSNSNTLNLVHCVGGSFNVSPFSGLAVDANGTLLISGGVGGMTVYEFDTDTGFIREEPRILNAKLSGVIGHPDAIMLDPNRVALSTDFDNSPRFGTMIVDVSDTKTTPRILRDFRVEQSLQFELALGPANFPLVNAFDPVTAQMYTANGALTVQNPFVDGGTKDLSSFISTRAVTCAIDRSFSGTTREFLAVGCEKGGDYFIEVLYVGFDDSSTPKLVMREQVSGRLTSLDVHGTNLAYSTAEGGLKSFHLMAMDNIPSIDSSAAEQVWNLFGTGIAFAVGVLFLNV